MCSSTGLGKRIPMKYESLPLKITIATLHFPPDRGPSAPIYSTLAEGLEKEGMDVSVIALQPHYDPDSMQHRLEKTVENNGVRVLRENLGFSFRAATGWEKIWALIKTNLLFYRLYKKAGPSDWIIIHSPVFIYALLLLFAIKNESILYHVQDLYPDIYCQIRGTSNSSSTSKLILLMERYAIEKAEKIVTISPTMAEELKTRTSKPEKVQIVHNPVSIPIEETEKSIKNKKFSGKKFNILFAGNMGAAQGLETILQAAIIVEKNNPEVGFLLVGDGSERLKLMKLVEDNGLGNVTFLPYKDPKSLPDLYASADAALVCLAPGMSSLALPSKLYTAMALGCPVLGLFDKGSYSEQLIEGENVGKVVTDYSPETIADTVQWMYSNPFILKQMGEKGLSFSQKYLNKENFVRAFVEILSSQEIKNGKNKIS